MRDEPDCMPPAYPSVIAGRTLTTTELKELAVSMGAAGFGVTTAEPFGEARATIVENRRIGMSGPLHFTYDDPDTATDVTRSLPWARSIVVFAHAYLSDTPPPAETGPVVARFATRDQYAPLRRIAEAVATELREGGAQSEVLIDDNRLVDRAAAARAGVGWLGKSTMVLAPGHGPWILLGSVVTEAVLEETSPMKRGCGTCVACVPACPTGAITPDGLDARLCISTWLQAPGPIPRWIRPLVERRIYGCDDCLTACPPGHPAMTQVRIESQPLSFSSSLALSDDELTDQFNWFYIPHRDPRFLRRNLLVAAGNSEEAEAVGPILDHFVHRSSLVRGHAYWALARFLGEDAWTPLRRRHAFETVPDALNELNHALLMIRRMTVG